jgi:hypothetical protein
MLLSNLSIKIHSNNGTIRNNTNKNKTFLEDDIRIRNN